ncbi:hypothetical protein [Solitalea canadensis]|uniref:P pilus assembly/Cpx signaling pathway, periplasmic inhibitor/zinc-resistance associated protein n=1 Tax=Solitalea canadensis (strain ATCC 29591 / DSM 3403 / JCM 21819 / LMG 8368 / NBRC 15130 / NCIMB 12057 / USAM 9D) TaxID=929556 RepID=H8KXY7_SOLCM|nr:hypothetical protein [Solitalea canadensis]AFD05663.1 hypothetical protein Solca_0533 [Solitalea canadensis DSM 3403]
MKKLNLSTLLLILFVTLPFLVKAQNFNQRKADIDALKVSIITTKVGLTTEEGKVFWPIYNEYDAEKQRLLKERRQKIVMARMNADNLSDKELEDVILNDFSVKQRELDLERKYYDKFKKVLSMKKVAKFYMAEEQFKRELIKRLRSQSQQPPEN